MHQGSVKQTKSWFLCEARRFWGSKRLLRSRQTTKNDGLPHSVFMKLREPEALRDRVEEMARTKMRLPAPGHANGFSYPGSKAGMASLEARPTATRELF